MPHYGIWAWNYAMDGNTDYKLETAPPYPWKCAICSDTCKRLGILGSSMYNTESSNETGEYGQGIVYAREGFPRQHAEVIIYRCSKPNEIVQPICQTCYDMCEAVSDPPIDALGDRRERVAEYFVAARTKEWQDAEQARKSGGGTGIKD